jgi:hypothetical protein
MAKKSAAPAVVERPLLGRVSNHLKMGIVGLPNVGTRNHNIEYLVSHVLAGAHSAFSTPQVNPPSSIC